MGEDLRAARDRALLLVGYAGAFRRSELVGIDVEHLEFLRNGVRVYLPRSKTDQRAEGRAVFIPRLPAGQSCCAMVALQRWLGRSGIVAGPIFRRFDMGGELMPERLRASAVAKKVRFYTRGTKVEGDFAGHSLHRGFI